MSRCGRCLRSWTATMTGILMSIAAVFLSGGYRTWSVGPPRAGTRTSTCPAIRLIQQYSGVPGPSQASSTVWDDMSAPAELCDELLEVRRRRYKEARKAGLSIPEALLFADGDTDLRWLRKLVEDGCDPALIANIVL